MKVRLPALTAKDRADIAVGVEEKVDFFALSFVREADDIDILRRLLSEMKSTARIIAKVEDQSGIANLDEIIVASDAVMVARGDLGIEVPMEDLPLIQKRAVDACIRHRKPVIVATHLLESMITLPGAHPGGGERHRERRLVDRRRHHALGRDDHGAYPLECVQFMKRVAGRIEASVAKGYNAPFRSRPTRTACFARRSCWRRSSATRASSSSPATAFCPRRSPPCGAWRCPIYAFTDDPQVFRHMLLIWGVEPFLMGFRSDPEETICDAFAYLLRRGWVSKGDWMVVVTNVLAGEKTIDSIQMRPVE